MTASYVSRVAPYTLTSMSRGGYLRNSSTCAGVTRQALVNTLISSPRRLSPT